MSVASSSLSNMSNLYNNPQLLGSLFPNINMQAINAAFQAEQLQLEQPLTQASQQLSQLSAPLSAWQTLQGDLQALQTDAVSLGGQTLYQGISATSTDPTGVTATASGTGSFGTYQVAVANLIQPEIDNSNGQASATAALGDSGSFSINGTAISVSSSDSLNQIATDINNADAGVTATVLNTGSGTGPYVLNLASTQGQAITWYDPNGVLADLGVLNANGTVNLSNQVQAAKAATYSVNGVTLSSVTNTDSTSIPGVTLNLLAPTSTAATVTVAQNTNDIQSGVQQFVADFNRFLSDSQKYAGKGGAIEGNGTISAIRNQLLQIVNGTVASQPAALSNLTQAGISLSAPVGSPDQFTMSVDTSTLQSALAANPSAFASLWNGAGGIATQVNTLLEGALGTDGGVTSAIHDLQQEQHQLNVEISSPTSSLNLVLNTQLQSLQDQFNQLMQTLGALSAQSSAMTQYMNMLSNQNSGSGSGSGG